MMSGRPARDSMSSVKSTSSSTHMSTSAGTRCRGRAPFLGSLEGCHTTLLFSCSACWAALSRRCASRAASASARPSTSCIALDHGPSLLACRCHALCEGCVCVCVCPASSCDICCTSVPPVCTASAPSSSSSFWKLAKWAARLQHSLVQQLATDYGTCSASCLHTVWPAPQQPLCGPQAHALLPLHLQRPLPLAVSQAQGAQPWPACVLLQAWQHQRAQPSCEGPSSRALSA